jgi:hypothetical protein
VTVAGHHLRPVQWVAVAIACCWALALPIAACVAPAYSSTSVTGSAAAPGSVTTTTIATTTVTHSTATLVQENGATALLIACAPLLLTLAVTCALWRRGARKSGAGPLAWSCAGLLAAANLAAMLSVGVFVLPVTAAVLVACATHPTRPAARPGPEPAMLGR